MVRPLHIRRALCALRLPYAVVLVTGVSLAAVACRDVLAPAPGGLRPIPVSYSLNPAGRVVVSPDSMRGWLFYDDQRGVACTDVTICRLVSGPSGQPSGTGSAELALTTASDGKALLIADYNGVRLDQVTTLRYSTYRQTVDNGNNLAISLQLSVDYDLTDVSTGYQGRLVYEPYLTNGGQVMTGVWQSWDTKAGKWWGTRASVMRAGQAVTNPCVQSHPCTWAEVLAQFPNIGVRATSGALILKAGSGWANFRGNVDSLMIGINGANTLFDFESVLRYHLLAGIGAEVVTTPWPTDSVYASGAVVSYNFGSRPGRATPIVVLDDTLAAASGQIVMNRDHTIDVESDTIYSYATLQPVERAIADLESALLTSGDKVAANQAIVDFMMGQIAGGIDPAALARASEVAAAVAIDPVRDAVALDQVAAALAGRNYYVDIYSDGTFGTYSDNGPPPPLVATRMGNGLSPEAALPSQSAIPIPRRRVATTPVRPAMAHLIGPTRFGMSPTFTLVPTHAAREALASPDTVMEYTHIVFTNGIRNSEHDANIALALVTRLASKQRRFRQDFTTVMLHYNPEHGAEMKQYDAAHPCDHGVLHPLDWKRAWELSAVAARTACLNRRGSFSDAMGDLVESYRLRQAALARLAVTAPDTIVRGLELQVRALRNTWHSHVILVGHSEGTIIDALALQAVARDEVHAINTADRCIGAIALAPAIPRATYGLDEYHLKGLLAAGDILTEVGVSTPGDWQRLDAPVSIPIDTLRTNLRYMSTAIAGIVLHGTQTYLTGLGADAFSTLLTSVHKECIPGSGSLTVTPSTASVGSTVRASVSVLNQNGRPLLGRVLDFGWTMPVFGQLDSVTFLAYSPRDTTPGLRAHVSPNLSFGAAVSVPVVPVSVRVIERDTSYWNVWGGSNGGIASPVPGPVPTAAWDGSGGACLPNQRVPGEGASYLDYRMICGRYYTLDFVQPATLASGLPVVGSRAIWTGAAGSTTLYANSGTSCPPVKCWMSVTVEFMDATNHVVGRGTASVP